MEDKLYWYWGLAEISAVVFLIKGISGWVDFTAFLSSHGLAVFLTYLIFVAMIGTDSTLRKRVITKGFTIFLFTICVVPVIGPAATLFFLLFLRFYPLHAVRKESFEKVNRDVLLVLYKEFGGRVTPITEAILSRNMNRSDIVRMVAYIGDMEWSATKSGILKYIIRLSPFQSVVLMAIDLLNKKMDEVLAEIVRLESSENRDHETDQSLAILYHEICYLDLCEPVMKPFYQEKSCKHALSAFAKSHSEDDAFLCVRYLLEADKVTEAKKIYDRVREKGDYFFPKWITYEFEMSLRLSQIEMFDNLSLLIKTAGGVFIPNKVKEAARAWEKVLTSAWL